jgi:hypothetical protein
MQLEEAQFVAAISDTIGTYLDTLDDYEPALRHVGISLAHILAPMLKVGLPPGYQKEHA